MNGRNKVIERKEVCVRRSISAPGGYDRDQAKEGKERGKMHRTRLIPSDFLQRYSDFCLFLTKRRVESARMTAEYDEKRTS